MFARYEEKWRETWIPDDNVPEMNFLMQRGGFQKIVGVMDEAMNTMFTMRFNNHSFPEIALNIVPKVAPALPAIVDAVGGAKPIILTGMKKANSLMALMGMGKKE